MKARTSIISISVSVLLTMVLMVNLEAGKKYSERSKEVMSSVQREETEMPDGRISVIGRNSGTVIYEDTNHPLHMSKKICIGITIRDANRETFQGSGTCQMTDADGDVAWSWWQGNNEGGTWVSAHGTGKYEGIKGEGTWKRPAVVEFPDGGWILEIDGTTELK